MTKRDEDSSSSLPEILGSLARTPEDAANYLRGKVSDFDLKKGLSSIRRSPVTIKRALVDSTVSDLITKVPVITVILCLTVTALLGRHSGILDCRDGFENDYCDEEGALNVNGDMAVYLPVGSEVQRDIELSLIHI